LTIGPGPLTLVRTLAFPFDQASIVMASSESRVHGDVQADLFWLVALMGRCQMLVARLSDAAPAVLIDDVKTLFLGLPARRKHTEETLVRMVFSRMLSSVIKAASLDEDAQIRRGFIELTNSSTFGDWRREWLTILERASAALGDDRTKVRCAVDIRVKQMLSVIDQRYSEFGLSVRDVAREVSLSQDHAALLLKQQTGVGFGRHLRRVRVVAARKLLLTSPLSIKEIASAVGYRHASQLSRHFKKVYALTPAAFRANHRAGVLTETTY
jgi:AraC-like DNA-binding protein